MNIEKKTTITLFKSPSTNICNLVFLILLFAKIFGYVDISWWIVSFPLWGPIAICFSLFLFFYVLAISIALILMSIIGIITFLEFSWCTLKKPLIKSLRKVKYLRNQ